MNAQDIHAKLAEAHPSLLAAHDLTAIDPWIEVKPEGLVEVCRFLRDQRDLGFDMLQCVTAVDYFEPD
jgi:NADH-quinone oxidoreductase subunit C